MSGTASDRVAVDNVCGDPGFSLSYLAIKELVPLVRDYEPFCRELSGKLACPPQFVC